MDTSPAIPPLPPPQSPPAHGKFFHSLWKITRGQLGAKARKLPNRRNIRSKARVPCYTFGEKTRKTQNSPPVWTSDSRAAAKMKRQPNNTVSNAVERASGGITGNIRERHRKQSGTKGDTKCEEKRDSHPSTCVSISSTHSSAKNFASISNKGDAKYMAATEIVSFSLMIQETSPQRQAWASTIYRKYPPYTCVTKMQVWGETFRSCPFRFVSPSTSPSSP